MQSWHWLAIEVAMAAIGLRVIARRVLPALRDSGDAALLIDVWLPLTLALPMIILAGWIGLHGHQGWTAAVGGPPLLGVIALALAWLAGAGSSLTNHVSIASALTWCATGAVLLLLGAVHELTIFAGQCAFAIAAVLLWLNTPGEKDDGGPTNATATTPGQERLAAGTLAAVILAAGIGACCVMVADSPLHASLSQAVSIVFAACALAAGVRCLTMDEMLRVGGWTATYGILFGLGIMSLTRLSPIVTATIVNHDLPPLPPVARGMGTYAPEATAMLALGVLSFTSRMVMSDVRRLAGWIVLILVAALLAWRLTGLAGAAAVARL
jgi:hypothetical protein